MRSNVAMSAVLLLLLAFSGARVATATRLIRVKAGEHSAEVRPWSFESFAARPWSFEGFTSNSHVRLSSERGFAHSTGYTCGTPFKVDTNDPEDEQKQYCPSQCPYYVEERNSLCTFSCVSAKGCAEVNPSKPFASEKLKICKVPTASACKRVEWWLNGTKATKRCVECNALLAPGWDGKCHIDLTHPVMWPVYLPIFLVLVVIIVVIWGIIHMARKPIINRDVLDHGLLYRNSVKCMMPKEVGSDTHRPWPLNTNLLTQDVAGAGVMLHFHFQLTIIIWAFAVAFGWLTLATLMDWDLLVLGTRSLGTPRRNCYLMAWGHRTQMELMWIKVYFLAGVYICSFAGTLYFAVMQERRWNKIHQQTKTMYNFALRLDNLPKIASGDLEERIKSFVEGNSHLTLVGVSVCWDFHEQQDRISHILGQDCDEALGHTVASPRLACQEGQHVPPGGKAWRKRFIHTIKRKLFPPENPPEEETQQDTTEEMLLKMQCSGTALVVFHSEADRDAAVQSLQATEEEFQGQKLQARLPISEPESVFWHNFRADASERPVRTYSAKVAGGLGVYFTGLLAWFCFFYYPYYWSITGFDYSDGDEPGIFYSLALTIVVVIGNNIMYFMCAKVADDFGFQYKWKREACYMVTYTLACIVNVMLDMVTSYWAVLERAKALELRTYGGSRLWELPTLKERFESYAVQRLLGENMFYYAVPSTYLVCFLIEPLATIFLPLQLSMWLVRSEHSIHNRHAEGLLVGPDMDMGRYADILLNVVLGIFMFFFPGGYTHSIFFWLAFSHIYIYCYDQWRLLRSVPKFCIRSNHVDQCAFMVLIPCCGLILAAMVFKANCTGAIEGFCVSSHITVIAFVIHCVVHSILLCVVVPMFTTSESAVNDPRTYEDIARQIPQSWFSTNPVHCLRSKYLHKHDPPCVFAMRGKGHLLRVNEAIGCYYQAKDIMPPESPTAEYDISELTKQAGGLLSRGLSLRRDLSRAWSIRTSTDSAKNDDSTKSSQQSPS